MTTRLFESASEISTHFRCDNCGVTLNKVSWMQCHVCKSFDLCELCSKTEHPKLPDHTLEKHKKFHKNASESENIPDDCMKSISVQVADAQDAPSYKLRREKTVDHILNKERIEDDYDLSVVMNKLSEASHQTLQVSKEDRLSSLNSLVTNYQVKGSKRNVRVLCLDGGGVRGYMPIKIISELIEQKHIDSTTNELDPNSTNDEALFHKAQQKFTKQFDYIAGTSTGGLIAFCLAINHNILDLQRIYSDANHFFKRRFFGPLFCSKFDPCYIHEKINEIIDSLPFPNHEQPLHKHVTLLDIRNLLNPEDQINDTNIEEATITHGNMLEFVDEDVMQHQNKTNEVHNFYPIKREKVLLITAYNATQNSATVFNTSYSRHWGYLIADVLKATMAAPTYFPPYKIYKGTQKCGMFKPGETFEFFIDGGVFANDPELTTLWAIRLQWKKPVNYHLLSIGTGCYSSKLSESTWGGYLGWIFNRGILVNTLMDATRSLTELIGSNLAKLRNVRRMKLNYKITRPMALDDRGFVEIFNREWEVLKKEDDFAALLYFYENFINMENTENK